MTALLISYKRPENMARIVAALRAQTLRPELLLINNSGCETFGVERTVHVPWDAGPFLVVPFALYARTDWVMVVQDDLMPGDAEFVADALALAQERPESITGAFGRRLSLTPPHYGRDAWGSVEIVKSRFWVFRKAILTWVCFPDLTPPAGANDPWIHEDIWLSLAVGEGQPVHWASEMLRDRLVELPEARPGQDIAKVAYSHRPHHYREREAVTRRYIEELGVRDEHNV